MKANTEVISNVIKELGVSANLKGYYYIRYAIELMLNDMTLANYITKRLYPTIAEKFGSTSIRVERNIRHAIESGWNKANYDFMSKLFRYSIDARKDKPTNSEFIITVADYLLTTDDLLNVKGEYR